MDASLPKAVVCTTARAQSGEMLSRRAQLARLRQVAVASNDQNLWMALGRVT